MMIMMMMLHIGGYNYNNCRLWPLFEFFVELLEFSLYLFIYFCSALKYKTMAGIARTVCQDIGTWFTMFCSWKLQRICFKFSNLIYSYQRSCKKALEIHNGNSMPIRKILTKYARNVTTKMHHGYLSWNPIWVANFFSIPFFFFEFV